MSPDKANLLIVTYVVCMGSVDALQLFLALIIQTFLTLFRSIGPNRYADLKRCLYTSFDELLHVRFPCHLVIISTFRHLQH